MKFFWKLLTVAATAIAVLMAILNIFIAARLGARWVRESDMTDGMIAALNVVVLFTLTGPALVRCIEQLGKE
jgi:hypothetical protein